MAYFYTVCSPTSGGIEDGGQPAAEGADQREDDRVAGGAGSLGHRQQGDGQSTANLQQQLPPGGAGGPVGGAGTAGGTTQAAAGSTQPQQQQDQSSFVPPFPGSLPPFMGAMPPPPHPMFFPPAMSAYGGFMGGESECLSACKCRSFSEQTTSVCM